MSDQYVEATTPRDGRKRLLLRVRKFVGLVNDESLYAAKLLLKAGDEIVRSVFKQDDKTEGKKQKQSDPEQAAQQRHGPTVTYAGCGVNHRYLAGEAGRNRRFNRRLPSAAALATEALTADYADGFDCAHHKFWTDKQNRQLAQSPPWTQRKYGCWRCAHSRGVLCDRCVRTSEKCMTETSGEKYVPRGYLKIDRWLRCNQKLPN